jgi:hypothetical protein
MINTTAPTDVLTAIAIVRRSVAGLLGTDVVTAELDPGLELARDPERAKDLLIITIVTFILSCFLM